MHVEIQGDKVVMAGLQGLANRIPHAVRRGLSRSIHSIHREAYEFLSGPKSDMGGYPVPVVTGNLRRLLDFLEPGQDKTANGETFSVDDSSAMLFDSARYAPVIHDGTHSSYGHGPRTFAEDALEAFDKSQGVAATIDEEIEVELQRTGK